MFFLHELPQMAVNFHEFFYWLENNSYLCSRKQNQNIMKKTLFFTILFSILSVSMFGQLNISLHAKESNGINCGNTITRCYNSDHDVTTYFKGGKTYIDLVEISTQLVFNIDIMSDIEIMDMYVFKEKLFFCGRDSQRHWGIVGYLDIPDMQLLMPVTVTYFYVYSVL